MIEYLLDKLSFIESSLHNCGIILLGDFNRLDVSRVKRQFRLKQMVNFSTRGSRTLDLFLTNLSNYYMAPEKLAPFGLSDHFTVLFKPKSRGSVSKGKQVRKVRDLRPSRRAAMSSFVSEIDWSILDLYDTCESKLSAFESIVNTGMDILLPTKVVKIYNNEPAWVTPKLKSLIHQRQKALASGNQVHFKRLRNQVNRERKSCRGAFYTAKVKQLKESKPKQWWKSS
jgi:hypothetical protein